MRKNNSERFFIYFLLFVFLIIAYLPLSSFLFALKNDALTTNFPNKYFFSAALSDGYLPIWNPYMNFGLPLYADPGFAFWNPLTWIFGWIGYSVPLLTVEILFYIWIAGVTAFELGIWLGNNKKASFCLAIMYMCCGFYVGNLQHTNFLTCAAFLPFVLKTFLDIQNSFSNKKLFYCLLSLYLLASGGHPAIPIACIYFLFIVQIGFLVFNVPKLSKKQAILRLVKTDILLAVGFLVLAAPLIYSYFEILPYFTRANSVIQSAYADTGFDFSSYISFVFPFSNTGRSQWLQNDPLMRNGYFSLAGFLCFVIALVKKKNNFQKIFLFAGIIMLLFSLGGQFKEWLFSVLPLFDHVRTNGEIRVFGILSLILIASYTISDYLEDRNSFFFRRLLFLTGGISLIIILSRLFYANSSTIFQNNIHEKVAPFFLNIKKRLFILTFFDRLFVNAVVVFTLICFYFLFSRKVKTTILLPLFIVADLIALSWLNLGVTGVQILSPFQIQEYLSAAPPGIPIPKLQPIDENQYKGVNLTAIFGPWSYYSKQPGTPAPGNYPSRLDYTVAYFNSQLPESMNKKEFIFTKYQPLNNLKISVFSPQEIAVRVVAEASDSLVLLQNRYFLWTAAVNGKATNIEPYAMAFMKVPIEKGVSEIKFSYNSNRIKFMTILSILGWILFSLFVFFPRSKLLIHF